MPEDAEMKLRWSIEALNCQSFIISRENSAECPTNFRFSCKDRSENSNLAHLQGVKIIENMHMHNFRLEANIFAPKHCVSLFDSNN